MWLFLTIISALLYSSLVEYCLHRFALHHSPKQIHITNHHKKFHGIKSYQLSKVNSVDVVSSKKYILSNILLALPISLIISTLNIYLGILFITISIVYTLWVEYLHYYFHKSNNARLEKLKFFQRLKEHHRVHHYIYNSNYGMATRFWDKVFRTKR
ncbi:sterol desaturase family protein [Clostridium sp. MSJ-4]|uniref:Sterol desaturase family protein n=1 Tax=Clostridium simiarum TaxID=2841506 RepID=A0ABS6F1K2_9CLOT|nr:sterol desaturase family protein [Clostridium simiarum]MBU5592255.1 sterol desaturase family protein [Clostridium simiarum]